MTPDQRTRRNVNHGHNSPHPRPRRPRLRTLLLLILVVLLSAIVVTTRVASRIEFRQFRAHAARHERTGAKSMLNDFVATGKRLRAVRADRGNTATHDRPRATTNETIDGSGERKADREPRAQASPRRTREPLTFAASAASGPRGGIGDVDGEGEGDGDDDNDGEGNVAPINALVDRSHRIVLLDQNRTLAFVHIGKSGGSTISLLLRNGCLGAADGAPCEPDRWRLFPGQREETVASLRIQFYLHTAHVDGGRVADYYRRVTSVVIVARDPLDRFASAFLSQEPHNLGQRRTRNSRARTEALRRGAAPPVWAKPIHSVGGDPEADQIHRAAYRGCYPTLEKFAQCADPAPRQLAGSRRYLVYNATVKWRQRGWHSTEISLDCRSVCRGIATGKNNYIHHLRFNYEAFLKDLPPEAEVFVIRTNKLWEDWITLNNILGARRRVDIPARGSDAERINAQQKLPVKNNLSPSGRQVICRFLTNEIRIYIDLLNRAVNLSDDDIREAIGEVQSNCPSVVVTNDGSHDTRG